MCSPRPARRAGKVHFRGLPVHQRVMDVVDPSPGRIHARGKSSTWSAPRGEPMAMGRHRRTWTPPSGPRAYLMLPSHLPAFLLRLRSRRCRQAPHAMPVVHHQDRT